MAWYVYIEKSEARGEGAEVVGKKKRALSLYLSPSSSL
jgi:hypothetical protein